MILFILLHNVPKMLGRISPRLLPPGWHDLKEPYDVAAILKTQQTEGRSKFFALLPPWLRKLTAGDKHFYKYTPEEMQRILEGRKMTQDAGNAAAELRQKERDDLRRMMGLERQLQSPEIPELHHDVEQGPSSGRASSYEDENKTPRSGLFTSSKAHQ